MNSWYEWDGVDPVGKPRIREYIVAFYEDGKCYDEARFQPEDISKAMPFLMQEDCKVFAVFGDDGKEIYELRLCLPI